MSQQIEQVAGHAIVVRVPPCRVVIVGKFGVAAKGLALRQFDSRFAQLAGAGEQTPAVAHLRIIINLVFVHDDGGVKVMSRRQRKAEVVLCSVPFGHRFEITR